MKKLISLLVMAFGITLANTAIAHESKPSHGGTVQNVDELHFELVSSAARPMIYIEDHGKKLSTAGASGKLIVLNGSEKSEFVLQPVAENALAANTDVKLKPGAKVIATITLSDKKSLTVRFAIK